MPRRPGEKGPNGLPVSACQLLGGHLPRAGVYVGSLHQGQEAMSPHSLRCSASDLVC